MAPETVRTRDELLQQSLARGKSLLLRRRSTIAGVGVLAVILLGTGLVVSMPAPQEAAQLLGDPRPTMDSDPTPHAQMDNRRVVPAGSASYQPSYLPDDFDFDDQYMAGTNDQDRIVVTYTREAPYAKVTVTTYLFSPPPGADARYFAGLEKRGRIRGVTAYQEGSGNSGGVVWLDGEGRGVVVMGRGIALNEVVKIAESVDLVVAVDEPRPDVFLSSTEGRAEGHGGFGCWDRGSNSTCADGTGFGGDLLRVRRGEELTLTFTKEGRPDEMSVFVDKRRLDLPDGRPSNPTTFDADFDLGRHQVLIDVGWPAGNLTYGFTIVVE